MAALFISQRFLRLTLLILLLHTTMTALLVLSEGIAAIHSLIGIGLIILLFAARSLLKNDQPQAFWLLWLYVLAPPIVLLLSLLNLLPSSPLITLIELSWLFFAFLLLLMLRTAYRQFHRRSTLFRQYFVSD